MRVLTIRDIPINVHVSWLVIYGPITAPLAAGYFPRVGPAAPGSRILRSRSSKWSSDAQSASAGVDPFHWSV